MTPTDLLEKPLHQSAKSDEAVDEFLPRENGKTESQPRHVVPPSQFRAGTTNISLGRRLQEIGEPEWNRVVDADTGEEIYRYRCITRGEILIIFANYSRHSRWFEDGLNY